MLQFKVVWGTLQYLQWWKDTKIWLQHYFQNLQHLPQKYIYNIQQKRYKSKICARFKPTTHGLLACTSTDWATQKDIKFCTNKNYKWKEIFIVYFLRKYVT